MTVVGRILIIACLAAVMTPATAQMYRWTDDEGRVHYSDTPPPEAARQERRVIDERGITVRTLERARTPAELDAQQREQRQLDQERREREEREHRDRVLLQSFGSERELITARDDRVALLDSNLNITEEKIRELKNQLTRLEERQARVANQGREVPEGLLEDMASLQRQIDDQTRYRDERRADREALIRQFDADLQRLRELKAERR